MSPKNKNRRESRTTCCTTVTGILGELCGFQKLSGKRERARAREGERKKGGGWGEEGGEKDYFRPPHGVFWSKFALVCIWGQTGELSNKKRPTIASG